MNVARAMSEKLHFMYNFSFYLPVAVARGGE